MLALTRRGAEAERIWRPLPAEVEGRWRERFGDGEIDRLRAALVAVAREVEAPLTDFMPILRVVRTSNPRRSPAAAANATPTSTCRWCRYSRVS